MSDAHPIYAAACLSSDTDAFSDDATAARIAALYASEIRYCAGAWYAWDGNRWEPGRHDRAQEIARRDARRLFEAATETKDPRCLRQAFGRLNEPRIRGALKFATSDAALLERADALDAADYALNTPTGIVDLRTGRLRPHDPDELHTKITAAAYVANTTDDRWQRFLETTTGGDPDFIAYLRRAAGMTATGDTSEEIILFAHGPAATGKTTFLEALRTALGDYARTADFATFLAGRRDSAGASPDIARLAGARMAAASEVSAGQTFNAARLKALTGGDRILARQLYGAPFEFTPRFTLWLTANERPTIAHDDDGVWRRVRLLPFARVVSPAERDPTLKRHLTNDPQAQAAVLAWIVQGALEWHQHGLGTCAAVEHASREYRQDSDPLAGFLQDRCITGTEYAVAGGELYRAYQTWAERNAEEQQDNKAFARALKAHGFTRVRTRLGARWQGIDLAGAPRTEATTVTGDAS
jgi:putative DNA primase/helicase